ncbi:MAG: NAD(P)-dependent oxidoreductase [Brooklawnia sp.]
MNDTKQIGFVGATGLMGHGLAKNILLHGHPLAYTMRQRAPQGLDELGATRAVDNVALGATSDIVVICVTSAADVEQVVTELLTDPKPGLIIMDASTSEPSTTLRLAELAAEKGARIADIPLTRGPAEAEAGTVNVLVGADDDLYAEIEPIIKCFADNIYRCGGLGAGHIIKLINNTAFQAALTILAEGFAVAVKSGVDPSKLTEVLSGGGFANGGTLRIMEDSLNGKFDTLRFQLDNARKDVRYYTRMAGELAVPAMVGDGIHEALCAASALGFGGEFCASLTKAQAKLNGITIEAGEPGKN